MRIHDKQLPDKVAKLVPDPPKIRFLVADPATENAAPRLSLQTLATKG
ncbi:hypothetical protein ABZT08_31765 [Streptomyces sp. NPDC005526]